MCRGDNTSQIKDAIFPGLAITHLFFSTAYFALKGHMTVTSRGCRWCVQCTVKVAQNILLKVEKSQQKAYMLFGYSPPFHWQHRQHWKTQCYHLYTNFSQNSYVCHNKFL
jgi:hypothetical protein